MSLTTSEGRMDRRDVEPWASVFMRHLAPACEDIAIAGSIRRAAATVGDIEIVLLPKYDVVPTLFDKGKSVAGVYTALERRLEAWVQRGLIAVDTDVKRMGPKCRRYTATALGGRYADPAFGVEHSPGMVVELYIADAANFGNTLTLRTGCSEFTKAAFSARASGGLLPKYLTHHSGYLWFEPPGGRADKIPCRSEQEFFRQIKLPYLAPRQRDEEGLEKLRALMKQ